MKSYDEIEEELDIIETQASKKLMEEFENIIKEKERLFKLLKAYEDEIKKNFGSVGKTKYKWKGK